MPAPKTFHVRSGALTPLFAAFTAMRPRPNPDDVVPGSTEARDEMSETDWFPVFRSGKYSQGTFTRADVDQIAEEFAMSGRRPPIVFDHLNAQDLSADAKPGSAAGYGVECRAVDDTDPRYSGERLLEMRAKVCWWASYQTRSGGYRNCSIGIAKEVGRDGKKRLCFHHLALLGAAPPGVNGLPEVIFSAAGGESGAKSECLVLSFCEDETPTTPTKDAGMSMISFADHQAAVQVAEEKVRTELTAKFTADLEAAQAATTAATEATAAVQAELDTVKAESETVKAELETVKTELDTVKTDSAVKVEEVRAEARDAGYKDGLFEGERRFNEQREKEEIESFCDQLRQTGRVNEAERAELPAMIFAQQGEQRARFRALLQNRPGLPMGDSTNFTRPPETEEKTEKSEEALLVEAQALFKNEPTRFSNLSDAFLHVRREHATKKETT